MKKLLFLCLCSLTVHAQVLQLAELNTEQIKALDRQKTVILIPGGILEEHGPYLPSYTDGYMTEKLARDVAEAIVARPGWTAVLTPPIPLGHGGANIIGHKFSFPGSYTVRAETLRDVYMDLGDAFGQQKFQWIFILHDHGAPEHHHALDQAGDYFHDTYGGRMVPLFGIAEMYFAAGNENLVTPQQAKENGLPIHADLFEQSSIMFLRPDLVPASVHDAPTISGQTFPDLVRIAERDDWPGYFGALKYASPSIGARDYQNIRAKAIDLTWKIIDGADPHSFPGYYAAMQANAGNGGTNSKDLQNDALLRQRQQDWLAKQKYR